MSHAALAAALRLDGMSQGERLVAFALASFANREHRAWPGTSLGAARAGLSRSQYLAARDRLAQLGLVELDAPGGGRGRSAVVWLRFAELGPWADVEVNPGLVEAVLTHSRTRGAARLLLATLAALADAVGDVSAVSADELQAAAGMADSTYRRARTVLLACGELVLAAAGGGRARTNRWTIPDPRAINPEPIAAARRRAAPTPGLRPLMMTIRTSQPATEAQLNLSPAASGVMTDQGDTARSGSANSAQNRTVSRPKGPESSGVSGPNPAQIRTVSDEKGPRLTGVSERNPGQDRTFAAKPRHKPRQKPRHPTRAREGNPRTLEPQKDPPTSLKGGKDRRSRSSSNTSPRAADDGNGRSPSTPSRPRRDSGRPATPTTPTGNRSATS